MLFNQHLLFYSFFSGIILFCSMQMMITTFYDWNIRRKMKARDEVTRKKVAILEKVKETETFKVAVVLLLYLFIKIG